jgi:hypothetical protein
MPFAPPSAGRRGLPMRAGWNKAAEVSAQTSDSANSLPMLDIPRLVGQPGGLEEQHKTDQVVIKIWN